MPSAGRSKCQEKDTAPRPKKRFSSLFFGLVAIFFVFLSFRCLLLAVPPCLFFTAPPAWPGFTPNSLRRFRPGMLPQTQWVIRSSRLQYILHVGAMSNNLHKTRANKLWEKQRWSEEIPGVLRVPAMSHVLGSSCDFGASARYYQHPRAKTRAV